MEQHPLVTGFCSASFEDARIDLKSADEAGEGGPGEIEGNIHMLDDLISWVPNVERKCALTCPVSDAQDCPFERVWVKVSVCVGRASQPNGRPPYVMIILLGRGTNYITD